MRDVNGSIYSRRILMFNSDGQCSKRESQGTLQSGQFHRAFPVPVSSHISSRLFVSTSRLSARFCFCCRNEVSHISMVESFIRTGSVAFNKGIISRTFGWQVLFDVMGLFGYMFQRAN